MPMCHGDHRSLMARTNCCCEPCNLYAMAFLGRKPPLGVEIYGDDWWILMVNMANPTLLRWSQGVILVDGWHFFFAFAPWVNPVTFCWKWSMVQWWIFMDFRKQFCGEILHYPIGSMYAIGNIYHQYSPNVSIYICHTWILWVRWLPSSEFSIAMFVVDVPGRPKTRRSSCWHHRSEPRRKHGMV